MHVWVYSKPNTQCSGLPCWHGRSLVVNGETTKVLLVCSHDQTQYHFRNHLARQDEMGPPAEKNSSWVALRNGPSEAYRPYNAHQKTGQAGEDCGNGNPTTRPGQRMKVEMQNQVLKRYIIGIVELRTSLNHPIITLP